MKISQEQLKKIIKEELAKQLQEDDISEEQVDEIFGKLGSTVKNLGSKFANKLTPGGIARNVMAGANSSQQSTSSASTTTPATTVQQAPASTGTQTLTQPKQVPVFKATPDSKGDVLSMRLKPLFSKVGGDQILTQYLKMISNQLKANGVKLMEANLTEKGENLSAQLGGFKSKTAQDPGTAANIQKGSVDLFGPAVMLLKQTNPQMDQKTAVTLAKQIQDITSKHLQKYGVNLPQKAIRVPKPVAKPTAAQPTAAQPTAQKKDLGSIKTGDSPQIGFAIKGFDDNQKKQLIRTLSSQGFKSEQTTKVVNSFSDWLKSRSKQPETVKEGMGSAQVRELVAQFAKETNLGMDEKLRSALINATIKIFGNPAQQVGVTQRQTAPVKKDAEIPAKIAQPAAPIKIQPPVEDSTGQPVVAKNTTLPARPLPSPEGETKNKGVAGTASDLGAKAVKTSSIQVPDKYKGGLSAQQMKSVTVKAAKSFGSPEQAQKVANEFSDWLKEKASIKTLQELRSFLREATENELATLFDQFLKQKSKNLTPEQRSALLSAFSSTEEAPSEEPSSTDTQDSAGNKETEEKEVKQSNHPIATTFRSAMQKVSALDSGMGEEAKKFSKSIDQLIETGAAVYQTNTGDKIQFTTVADLLELLKSIVLSTMFVKHTKEQTEPQMTIRLFQTFKELQKDFDSINNQLGKEGVFAGNIKFFFPEYGMKPNTDTQKVFGTQGDGGSSVVGGRQIGHKSNKELRPTSVILGKPNPQIMNALGTPLQESKKPVSYNQIYDKWQKIIKG